jgi:hypothetical protein
MRIQTASLPAALGGQKGRKEGVSKERVVNCLSRDAFAAYLETGYSRRPGSAGPRRPKLQPRARRVKEKEDLGLTARGGQPAAKSGSFKPVHLSSGGAKSLGFPAGTKAPCPCFPVSPQRQQESGDGKRKEPARAIS